MDREESTGADPVAEVDQSGNHVVSARESTTATQPTGSSRVAAMRDKGASTMVRVREGSVGTYWSHLTAADFMNSSMNFAALGLLCALPLFTVLDMVRGHDVASGIITKMGLNAQAAADVRELIAPTHQSVSTVGVSGAAFLLLGGIGLAATMQGWYQKVYDVPPLKGAWKALGNQAIWLVSFVMAAALTVTIGRDVRLGGDRVLSYLLQFTFSVVFWWWSVHLLLRGRLGWRQTLPTALATGFCLTGLAVFSALLFSGSITSGVRSYGPIGVVTVLMSYLIGLGVCVHLGAVFGRMWYESHSVDAELSSQPEPDTTTTPVRQV